MMIGKLWLTGSPFHRRQELCSPKTITRVSQRRDGSSSSFIAHRNDRTHTPSSSPYWPAVTRDKEKIFSHKVLDIESRALEMRDGSSSSCFIAHRDDRTHTPLPRCDTEQGQFFSQKGKLGNKGDFCKANSL